MIQRGGIVEKGEKCHGRFTIVHGSIIQEVNYREATVLRKLVKLALALGSVALYVHIFQVDMLVFLE